MSSRRGLTLIEVLVALALVASVAMLSIPRFRSYQVRQDLNTATEQIVQGMARAKLFSQLGKNDSAWGFYAPSGTLYMGDSYAERDVSYDEVYPMPSTIVASGTILEVAYSRLEGVPNQTGSIVLTALDEQRIITVEIAIHRETIAANVNDRLVICHNPGTNQQTKDVPDNAWPGHQRHGDYLGPCVGGSSSSTVSSSAASSSVAGSSAASSVSSNAPGSSSSSAGGGGGSSSSAGYSCLDRFTMQGNGTILTTSPLTMRVTGIASQITYGAGGPSIPVTLKYTLKGGNPWKTLFGGAALTGGLLQTVSNVAADSQVALQYTGTYKKNGWLMFSATYRTNQGSNHAIFLRQGDALPSYLPYGNQQELQTLLAPYLDIDHRVNIGPYALLSLVELSTVTTPPPPSEDFQDGVILLEFDQEAGACD